MSMDFKLDALMTRALVFDKRIKNALTMRACITKGLNDLHLFQQLKTDQISLISRKLGTHSFNQT